jgi:ParB family transcriptional regulator, chromosome partitioning protein
MEDLMSLKTVPLASLLPPKGNPRRTVDIAQIAALARSIKVDGLLQNLIVLPERDRFRVVAGKRRYLALQLLRKERQIGSDYRVPVEVKRDMVDGDALRLATVENVQREHLHPLDEAEAFASLLQTGGTIEAISEKTGLRAQTIKRRLALANLCAGAKEALQSGAITRGIAEALTVGSEKQQHMILEAIGSGERPRPEDIRSMLLDGKPSVAIAIFPKDRYSGTFTTDLFGNDETTYFDDVDQFLALQKDAIEALAEEHRKTTAWVEILTLYSVPWWQYREAKKKERSSAGVVINMYPSGSVEVRTGLVKHAVKEEVVAETKETPIVSKTRERPTFSTPLLRYVAYHKSITVQAALLRNPRKAKEVTVLLLLAGGLFRHGIRPSPHPCLKQVAADGQCPAYKEIEAAASALADVLGFPRGAEADGVTRLLDGDAIDVEVYGRVTRLSDEELDQLLVLLPTLCFGQDDVELLDLDQSLFNRVAADLALNMRAWWTPDVAFLTMLRRDQLQIIAASLNGASRLVGAKAWSKTELVQALAREFTTPTAPSAAETAKSQRWLPGILCFPARDTISAERSEE